MQTMLLMRGAGLLAGAGGALAATAYAVKHGNPIGSTENSLPLIGTAVLGGAVLGAGALTARVSSGAAARVGLAVGDLGAGVIMGSTLAMFGALAVPTTAKLEYAGWQQDAEGVWRPPVAST